MYMAGSKANSQDPALTELHALNALKSRRPPHASLLALIGSVSWDGEGSGTQATTMTSVDPSSKLGEHVQMFYSQSEIQFPKTFTKS